MAIITRYFENKNPLSERWLAWFVSLSGGLLFFYEIIQMDIVNSISTQLMSAFQINAEQLGHLSSTYFYANISCLFLAGNLLDRFSTRRLILLAMTLCTIGTFGFGLANSALMAACFRSIIGFGGSFCFLSGVRLASRWLSPKRMALATGLLVLMCFAGGWVAQTPATYLIDLVGWRQALVLDGALGILIIVWMWFVIQDYPKHKLEEAAADSDRLKEQGLWKSIKMVLSNAQNWLGGAYTCLLNLPIYLLGAMWGKMYLQQVEGFSSIDASFICGMLFIGSIVGSPLMGYISDLLKRRRLPMLIGAVLSLIVILLIAYVPGLSYITYCGLFFFLGLLTCSQVISYPLVVEHNPHILTGTSVSIVSMTCLLGGAFGLPFSGWLLDLNWDGKIVNGAPWYSAAAYHHAMLIMPIAFVVAFVVACFVKETFCQPQHDR